MQLNEIVNQLNWRAATKSFDPSKKVSDEQFAQIMEATRLAPSSYGLQPWKFVVVRDTAIREALRAAGYNQAQITDASHLVVLCSRLDMNPEYVESYVKSVAETRQVPVESLQGFKDMMLGSVVGKTPEQVADWNARQTYIALGTMLTVCAASHIDACPMEGFDANQFDKILGLENSGYTARVVCAIGYRADHDWVTKAPKVRFPIDQVVVQR